MMWGRCFAKDGGPIGWSLVWGWWSRWKSIVDGLCWWRYGGPNARCGSALLICLYKLVIWEGGFILYGKLDLMHDEWMGTRCFPDWNGMAMASLVMWYMGDECHGGEALLTNTDVYHVQGEVMINTVGYEDPMVYFWWRNDVRIWKFLWDSGTFRR